MTAPKIQIDQATKLDTPISIDPSSVRMSLRTTQKPSQAPARIRKSSRNMTNCNTQSNDQCISQHLQFPEDGLTIEINPYKISPTGNKVTVNALSLAEINQKHQCISLRSFFFVLLVFGARVGEDFEQELKPELKIDIAKST